MFCDEEIPNASNTRTQDSNLRIVYTSDPLHSSEPTFFCLKITSQDGGGAAAPCRRILFHVSLTRASPWLVDPACVYPLAGQSAHAVRSCGVWFIVSEWWSNFFLVLCPVVLFYYRKTYIYSVGKCSTNNKRKYHVMWWYRNEKRNKKIYCLLTSGKTLFFFLVSEIKPKNIKASYI